MLGDDPEPRSAEREPPRSGFVDRLVASSLPWMTSLTVNLALLVLLAICSVTGVLEKLNSIEVSALFNSEPDITPVDLVEIVSIASESPTVSFPTATHELTPTAHAPEELNTAMLAATNRDHTALLDSNEFTVTTAAASKPGLMGLPSSSDLNALVPTTTAKGPVTERELKERSSLRDIALDVGSEIRDKLSEDSLLVVWLMDASISLVDNRLELANHLDQMYANIEAEFADFKPAKGEKKRLLMNSVVAFGNGAQGISAPYRVPTKATIAMRNMPVDPSGRETTCQAVMWTAAQARAAWNVGRGQIMIVVFTDESGDDTFLLEETIEVCRQNKVNVSIIGPSAILGTDQGFHRWHHPRVPTPFWLPVVKGPDSAIPERLRLPYWWSTENLRARLNIPAEAREFPTDLQIKAEWQARLPEWAVGAEVNPSDYFVGSYSGRELLNLNSGFPPWGLMRLVRETGGTYTMFDRHGDRGPFRLELMRRYTPDYRSLPELLDEMRYYPLRLAVVNAAALTRKYAPQTTPQVHFWDGHCTPEQFRRYCNDAFPAADAQVESTALLIEQALAGYGANGMEAEYERESSPRWQAWYDLSVGRLLLQSVRFAEYRLTLRMIDDPRGFPQQANQINLFPYATIRAGERSLRRAEEGERLLKRCLEKNPGTPYAFLAARELEHPLSVDFNWRYVPPPPPPPPSAPSRVRGPAPEPIVLPNL